MGKLIYGVAPAIEIDDRALRHLQVVMLSKLRRDERFAFSWGAEPDVGEDVAADGDGHFGTVWVSSASSLYFSYDAKPTGSINRAWLELLSSIANQASGLRLAPEPPA